MPTRFTLSQARATLDEVRPLVDEVIAVRADLATHTHAHNVGASVSIAEIKALEARMSELLDAVRARGVQVKGYAPVLLDFPCEVADRVVLLCWIEGELELGWYHEPELGFMGRRRLVELADQLPTRG